MSFKVKDHYFKKAKKENYLARSIYKLEEVDKKYKVIKAKDNVVDFGYHPGSWTQYTAKKVENGLVRGIDIKPVNKQLISLNNVELFEKDIFDIKSVEELNVDRKFDVVLSDMAPNTTGIKSVDQDRSLNLIEMVFSLLPIYLEHNGNLVIKVFDSQKAQEFLKSNRKLFKEFNYLKPKSTRSISKEFFVVAKGYNA